MARRARTRITTGEKTEHPFLVPYLGESIQSFTMVYPLRFSQKTKFAVLRKFPSVLTFVFSRKKNHELGDEFWQLIFLHILR